MLKCVPQETEGNGSGPFRQQQEPIQSYWETGAEPGGRTTTANRNESERAYPDRRAIWMQERRGKGPRAGDKKYCIPMVRAHKTRSQKWKHHSLNKIYSTPAESTGLILCYWLFIHKTSVYTSKGHGIEPRK
jgi:hypothetical protein